MNIDPSQNAQQDAGVSSADGAEGAAASNGRLSHLLHITEALAGALTPEAVAQAVITYALPALGARMGLIALLSQDESSLNVIGIRGFPEDFVSHWQTIPMSTPFAIVEAVRTGQAILIRSRQELKERYPSSPSLKEPLGDMAYAVLPLMLDSRALGVLSLGFESSRRFVPDEQEFLQAISRQCTIALERARLYDAERQARQLAERSRRDMEILAEASRVLALPLDYQTTLNTIAQAVVPALADWCVVDLAREAAPYERLAVAHKDPTRVAWARQLQEKYPPRTDAPQGVPNVMRTGKSEFYPVITDEMMRQPDVTEEQLQIIEILGPLSVMIVPMLARERTLGVITFLTTKESGRFYTEADLQLAEDLARRAAIAVDNARLYGETQVALEMHRSAEERLAALTQASGALLSSLKLDELLPYILTLAERLFQADAYALWRPDPLSGSWRPVCHRGLSEAFTQVFLPWQGSQPNILDKPVVVEDIESNPALSMRYKAHRAEGISALLVHPLTIRHNTGTLAFYYRTPHKFTDTEIRVAGAIANLASAAIGTTELYEEQDRLRAEAQASVVRQRAFIRDVLASVTEGKLFLCSSTTDLPRKMKSEGGPIILAKDPSLRTLRHQAGSVANRLGFGAERRQDLVTAVSEAAMNAVTHAGGGEGRVRSDGRDTIQVWITDHGAGIDVAQLPRATLEKGFTTAGSLGHGMKIMLSTVDRVWLLTGPGGTTVVLEQDRVAPQRAWE